MATYPQHPTPAYPLPAAPTPKLPVPPRYYAYLVLGLVSVILGAVLLGVYGTSGRQCVGGYCYTNTGFMYSGILLLIFGLVEMALGAYYIYAWKKNGPEMQPVYVTSTPLTIIQQQPPQQYVQPQQGYYYAAADPEAARVAMGADRAGGQPVYLPAYEARDSYASGSAGQGSYGGKS